MYNLGLTFLFREVSFFLLKTHYWFTTEGTKTPAGVQGQGRPRRSEAT